MDQRFRATAMNGRPHFGPSRKWLLTLAFFQLASVLTISTCWGANYSVEGIGIKDAVQVDGTPLVLNGAGYRKRGYSKFSVEALYLAERRQSLAGIQQLAGPKRIAIYAIRDVPGSTVARHFIADFEQLLSEAEFKGLITEVGQIGAAFGNLHRINRGDQINIDWLPGKGMTVSLNGKSVVWDGGSIYMKSDVIYTVLLRMHAGPSLASELQKNMLGLSRSMFDLEKESSQ